MNSDYIATVINSTIRSATPVMFAALASGICSQVGVFNIGIEGQMLVGCFASIVVNYFTGSILLALLAGILSGALVGLLLAILQVKYKAADIVVGTSINILMNALTSLLLFFFFGVKGVFSHPDLVPMRRINIPFVKDIPFIGRALGNLTILDYLSYLVAILLFVFLYKTVSGFKVRSIGINKEATESLGLKASRNQILLVAFSGALCGLGGSALAMGQVILFTENMTSGRGFIGMAAAMMGQSHPLLIILSSLIFGVAQSVGVAMQVKVPSQLTMAVPYIVTILVLALTGLKRKVDFKEG